MYYIQFWFNKITIELREWINDFIPMLTVSVIISTCPNTDVDLTNLC